MPEGEECYSFLSDRNYVDMIGGPPPPGSGVNDGGGGPPDQNPPSLRHLLPRWQKGQWAVEACHVAGMGSGGGDYRTDSHQHYLGERHSFGRGVDHVPSHIGRAIEGRLSRATRGGIHRQ